MLFELMMGIFLGQQILGHADLLSHRLMVGGFFPNRMRIQNVQGDSHQMLPYRSVEAVGWTMKNGKLNWPLKELFGDFSRARRTEQVEQWISKQIRFCFQVPCNLGSVVRHVLSTAIFLNSMDGFAGLGHQFSNVLMQLGGLQQCQHLDEQARPRSSPLGVWDLNGLSGHVFLGDNHEVCWRLVRNNFFCGGVFALVSFFFSKQKEAMWIDFWVYWCGKNKLEGQN